ncbi:dynamin family protein [Nostoc sp. UHCC 0252]|uniref:dynamin family protein n=1 Tax=Nostoc sp. UHCC 0252 TaxID=3110241 RepID=UPI002B1EBCCD|nr:dynamin family protein [Nostoc sp. UHCC 0252]MEA5601026.1 dynamin family protein [Nostoc sp. UHCC 0252]
MIDNHFSNSLDDWFDFKAESSQDDTEINKNSAQLNGDGLENCADSFQNYSQPLMSDNQLDFLDNSLKETFNDGTSEDINIAVVETIQIVISGVMEAVSDHWLKIENADDNISQSVVDANAIETQIPSPPPPEPSHDLTEWIRLWLDECLVLSNSSGCEDMTTELKALNSRWELPGFRLALVGEFSRGKSSLVNRLLNADILPVGDLPTTATLTSIVAGSENCMEVQAFKNGWEARPIEAISWRDITAIERDGSEQKVIGQVRLTLTHPWLQALDLELIDTPGVGDLSGDRAAFALDVLSQCDASILVVSATLPFSMTEATFLEQEVMGRHIPRILVAVSKLDTIPEEERLDVFNSICKRIAKISSTIPVLPLYSLSESNSDTEVFEAVKTQIESMVAKGDRRIWRSRKIAGQITDYLSHLIKVGELAISTAAMDRAEKDNALMKLNQEIQNAQIDWERIRLNLDQRRLQRTKALQQKILQAKAELLANLLLELRRTQDPKTWWEQDLPFRLRRELFRLSRQLESDVLKALSLDFEWLQQEVSKQFSTRINSEEIDTSEAVKIDLSLQELSLNEIEKYRIFTRLGGSAATICSSIFGGPIGVAVSTTIWVIGEQLIKEKLQQERNLLNQELEHSIDRSIDEYFKHLTNRLRQLYNQLSEEMEEEKIAWQAAYKIAFNSNNKQSENQWSQIISQAYALKREISRMLSL